MTNMRAKMVVYSATPSPDSGAETLNFIAVAASNYPSDGSDENNTYARFTPSGHVSLIVTNPALIGKFDIGDEYYLDFIKA